MLNMPGDGIANPIIQAEMHRGAHVAFKCSVGAFNARQVQSCLEKAINAKPSTAGDAFMLGLYFNAWRLARINAELRGDPDWTYATICDVINVQKYRGMLGLSMDAVMSEDGNRVYRQKWEEWEAQAPGKCR
jgi:hypothetical protein